MINLLKVDWDTVEKLINEMLNDHMRTWGHYVYLVINEDTVLVKVYENDEDDDKTGRLMFTIKAKLMGEKLEVVEVS
jgi:hypothetical protein